MMMTNNSMVARGASLVSSQVDGQAVIMNIDSGHFFQLNQTASRIWDLLETPQDLASINRQLNDRFDVDPERCRTDLAEFIGVMQQKGLLTVS
jgi:hypothetical protein